MENPKIRFKGFTKDWEQRKLGEVFEFQYGEFNNNPDNVEKRNTSDKNNR